MEPNIDRQPATAAETETGHNKEGTGYRCPNCHTLVGLDTPQCPGCGGLFKAGISKRRQELQDNPFDPRTEISADARHIASPSPIVARVEMAQERVWTSLTSLLHLHDTSNDCIWLNRTTCESVFKRPLAHSHFLSDDVVTRKRERRGGTCPWVDAAQDWSRPPA